MNWFIKQTFAVVCVAMTLVLNVLYAGIFEDRKKDRMIQDLEVIKHHLEVGYAPANWKKEYLGWDLEEVFEKSKNQILMTPSITTKQFQQIVRDFLKTTQDYHVSVQFFSTEKAVLPFTVKSADKRYFIDWIDPLRLPQSHYAISVGDELIEFDDRPVFDVIEELKTEMPKSANPSTDQALTEMKLTFRSGRVGDIVPRGSLIIKTKSLASGKIRTHQLRWSYTSEQVLNPFDFLETVNFLFHPSASEKIKHKLEIPKVCMVNPIYEAFTKKAAGHNRGLGNSKSFLPMLGEPSWIKENSKDEEELNEMMEYIEGIGLIWQAYIYHHPQGYSIGFIRIPHYIAEFFDSELVNKFGEIIKIMEEKTDALVIDQLHNPGGYVHFQYELASMLATEPLKTPYHRIKITQEDVIRAHMMLEQINLFELWLQRAEKNSSKSGEESKREDDSEEDSEESDDDSEETEDSESSENDIGVNYQWVMFLKAYYEHVIANWNDANSLTTPTPILGVDRINPHPKYQYTKPILMLIDEMDFSGGDFMPAILQDNHRAVLFGNKTAGAGGFVYSAKFPNSHGIERFFYTGSIAERVDAQKIENLGVKPDIEYQMTTEDLEGGYNGYIEAVNQAVQVILETPMIR